MARTINEQEFATRRNEILDVAQQLVYTVGYDSMTIQDILNQLGISKGAFYHYFRSKNDLLEALLERIGKQVLAQLAQVLADPDISAIEKLQTFYTTSAEWKTERKELLLKLLRGWYADENALVREKLRRVLLRELQPVLSEIVRQGLQEGSMHTRYPEQVPQMVLAIINATGDEIAELALAAADGHPDGLAQATALMQMYTNALERLLGIEPGQIVIIDERKLRIWFG